jgi:hypothetical protein
MFGFIGDVNPFSGSEIISESIIRFFFHFVHGVPRSGSSQPPVLKAFLIESEDAQVGRSDLGEPVLSSLRQVPTRKFIASMPARLQVYPISLCVSENQVN